MRPTATLLAMRPTRRLAPVLLALTLLVTLGGCSLWASSPKEPVVGPGCPAWTAGQKQPTLEPPGGADDAAMARFTAQLVTQTVRPVTNPYALTQRLVTRQKTPIACTVATTPPDELVGDERQFWVINNGQNGYHRIRARLDYTTPLLYVYVQDGATVDGLALKNAADQFEAQIYATDRAVFGAQWNLGPNHDNHITLLNIREPGSVAGYFSSADEYPSVVNPYSNERQMLYLNLDGGAQPGTTLYQTTLAHEFQHMIHWWERPADPSWVNEGMSVLAQQLNSLPTNNYERAWLAAPQTPLVNAWSDPSASVTARYGVSYAFMDYLYERYGGAAFLRDFMGSQQQVPQSFDSALAQRKTRDHFADAYAKFIIAALLNDPTIAHGAYSFAAFPGERAQLTGTIGAYPYASATDSLPQFGAAYYDVRPSSPRAPASTLTINFAGSPEATILPNTPYDGAPAEWWSNSGDNMDSTLTRALDLTNANQTPTPAVAPQTPGATTPTATATPAATPTPNPTPAPVTLTFQAWYDLEANFDYTYVEVSSDNGATWTALPTSTSTDANPNGKNLGHGMTGASGSSSSTPRWVAESVDLTQWSGKKILLRFETVMDDATHLAGFALDDLSVPAINLTDDGSSGSGWSSNGWVRSNNTLSQTWIVQAIVFHAGGGAPTIKRVPVDSVTGAGSVTFSDFGGSITHVELAIAPATWGSYVPAPYQLTATAL